MMDLGDSGGNALLSTIDKKRNVWRVRFGLRRLIVKNDIQK